MPTKVAGYEPGRAPSPAIWGHLPMPDNELAAGAAFYYFNDFHALPVEGEDAVMDVTDGGAGTASIARVNTELGGVLKLNVTNSDNTEVWWTPGVPVCNINAGNGKMVFEACFQVSSITDDAAGFAVGLVDILAAGDTVLQTDDDAAIVLAAVDFVGFNVLQADGDVLRAIHKDGGTAETAANSAAHTMVAATWMKVGLYFDGNSAVQFFVNDTLKGTVQYNATNFPENKALTIVLGVKTGGATAIYMNPDWVKCVQMKA